MRLALQWHYGPSYDWQWFTEKKETRTFQGLTCAFHCTHDSDEIVRAVLHLRPDDAFRTVVALYTATEQHVSHFGLHTLLWKVVEGGGWHWGCLKQEKWRIVPQCIISATIHAPRNHNLSNTVIGRLIRNICVLFHKESIASWTDKTIDQDVVIAQQIHETDARPGIFRFMLPFPYQQTCSSVDSLKFECIFSCLPEASSALLFQFLYHYIFLQNLLPLLVISGPAIGLAASLTGLFSMGLMSMAISFTVWGLSIVQVSD